MNASLYRTLIFLTFFMFLVILEYFFPYRTRVESRKARWRFNFSIAFFNTLILVLLRKYFTFFEFNLLAKIGLKNEDATVIVFSLIVLDFFIYLQHFLFHKISFLYSFHRFHHSDKDLDATSAIRFHTVEMIISFFYKLILIGLLGISTKTFLVFEVMLNAMAMFNHANIYLPDKVEKILRIFIVTPQMHIIHHSIYKENSDRNFGFNLSIWDYVFRTYQNKFKINNTIGVTDV